MISGSHSRGAYLLSLRGRGRKVAELPPIHGVFETILVRRRLQSPCMPLWLGHVDRLVDGAYRLGLELPADPEALHRALRELLFRIGSDLRLRLILGECGGETVIGAQWTPAPEVRDPEDPDEVVLHLGDRRTSPKTPLDPDSGLPIGRLKATERRFYDELQNDAVTAGAHEGLCVDTHDKVWETTISSLFLLSDDRLVTTPTVGPLIPGVGQSSLLAALRRLRPPLDSPAFGNLAPEIEVRSFELPELRRARAIWVTNALRGPRRARLQGVSGAGLAVLSADPLQVAWRAVVG